MQSAHEIDSEQKQEMRKNFLNRKLNYFWFNFKLNSVTLSAKEKSFQSVWERRSEKRWSQKSGRTKLLLFPSTKSSSQRSF